MKIRKSEIEDRELDEKRSIRHDKFEKRFQTERFISKSSRHYERDNLKNSILRQRDKGKRDNEGSIKKGLNVV
jgi:hypothetical protein